MNSRKNGEECNNSFGILWTIKVYKQFCVNFCVCLCACAHVPVCAYAKKKRKTKNWLLSIVVFNFENETPHHHFVLLLFKKLTSVSWPLSGMLLSVWSKRNHRLTRAQKWERLCSKAICSASAVPWCTDNTVVDKNASRVNRRTGLCTQYLQRFHFWYEPSVNCESRKCWVVPYKKMKKKICRNIGPLELYWDISNIYLVQSISIAACRIQVTFGTEWNTCNRLSDSRPMAKWSDLAELSPHPVWPDQWAICRTNERLS